MAGSPPGGTGALDARKGRVSRSGTPLPLGTGASRLLERTAPPKAGASPRGARVPSGTARVPPRERSAAPGKRDGVLPRSGGAPAPSGSRPNAAQDGPRRARGLHRAVRGCHQKRRGRPCGAISARVRLPECGNHSRFAASPLRRFAASRGAHSHCTGFRRGVHDPVWMRGGWVSRRSIVNRQVRAMATRPARFSRPNGGGRGRPRSSASERPERGRPRPPRTASPLPHSIRGRWSAA